MAASALSLLGPFPFLEAPPSTLQVRGTWGHAHPQNQSGSLVQTRLSLQRCPVWESPARRAPGPGFGVKRVEAGITELVS